MSLLKSFSKYQSLGNDFVMFDWYRKPSTYLHNELNEASFKQFVTSICNRHYGVGADGVLIITTCPQVGMPEMIVFNADGSLGDVSLNGLRSVAHYLFSHHHFPDHFSIKVGSRIVECSVNVGNSDIMIRLAGPSYKGQEIVETKQGSIAGYVMDIGNPHFIIFQEKNLVWLQQHGLLIEGNPKFPARTNVELVWETSVKSMIPGVEKLYDMIVHERGCGITLACSSGVAAVTGLLHILSHIKTGQKIEVRMPGGSVISWIEDDGQVVLQAAAHMVFKGSFENHIVVEVPHSAVTSLH